MTLQRTQPLRKEQLGANTVLFEADKPIELLTILHQGQVYAANPMQGNHPKLCMYTMPQNSILGFNSLLSHAPSPVSYISETNTLISAFPVQGNFKQITMGKVNVGFMAARSLLMEAIVSYQMITKLVTLTEKLYRFTDNIHLAYKYCLPELFEQEKAKTNHQDDPTLEAMLITVSDFERNGGSYPAKLTKQWLHSDHSKELKANYRFRTRFYAAGFQFFQKILNLPTSIQSTIYKIDSSLLESLSQQLIHILDQNIKELYILQDKINSKLNVLVGEKHGYTEKLYTMASKQKLPGTKTSPEETKEFVHFFCQNLQALLKSYQDLHKTPYANVQASVGKLLNVFPQSQEKLEVPVRSAPTSSESKNASPPTTAGLDPSAIRRQLQGSANQIMSLLQIPSEEKTAILSKLTEWKKLSSPLSVGQENRQLREDLAKSYWGIWEKGYLHYCQKKGDVASSIRSMLDFGFLDEELLDDEHLVSLWSHVHQTKSSQYPIFTATEWADKIYTKEEIPSVDDFARSYMRELNKKFSGKSNAEQEALIQKIDTGENRLKHEIKNFFNLTSQTTSGTPNACSPILNRYQLTALLGNAMLTKEKIAKEIDEILSIDYSAFHREVILTDADKDIFKEFIQEKVLPYFILVPSAGTKATVWQEVSNHSKSSPGRIACPAFATAPLKDLLIEAIAIFRWEIVKKVMGASWNNVSCPSITSEYTDYVQFYKKSRDLSTDVKAKLNVEFKKFRSDRDRFANDYSRWLKYESQGVPRMNKIVRGVFYRHVPFAKDTRNTLLDRPTFAEFHQRFQNIRTKKIKALENHYRKYGENIPEKLKANLEFYKEL